MRGPHRSIELDPEYGEGVGDDAAASETGLWEEEFIHLGCPECGRPIAVDADAPRLPVHGVCATPWNPFGVAVCGGSGQDVDGLKEPEQAAVAEFGAVRRVLPAGLDWRTQPFSDAGRAA